MKKIMNFLMLCALVVAFTSCKNEIDDIFDKTATERIDEALKSYNDILKSAPNGWIMYYYGATQYGGYNVLVKFNDDATATVANERIANGASFPTETSHYKMVQSAGVVLSFDEYNSIFHYYSDPVNPEGIGTDGTGFDGDLEFRVISASAEEVVLMGKKTNRRIVMVPMPQNMGWDEYLNRIKAIEKDMTSANVVLTINATDSIPTTTNSPYRRFSFTLTDEKGVVTTKTAPYVVTLDGYKFYTSVDLKGKKVENFKYIPQAMIYPEADDESVELRCIIPPINRQLVNSAWYVKKDDLSPVYIDKWLKMSYACWTNESENIYYGFLGNMSTNAFGCCIRSGNYVCRATISYTLVGDDEIKDLRVSAQDNNMKYYWTSCSMSEAVETFAAISSDGTPKHFKLTTDFLKAPSWIRLVDQNNPDNVITLYSSAVNYPFGMR